MKNSKDDKPCRICDDAGFINLDLDSGVRYQSYCKQCNKGRAMNRLNVFNWTLETKFNDKTTSWNNFTTPE